MRKGSVWTVKLKLAVINFPIYQTNIYSHNSNDKKKNTIFYQTKTF